MPSCKMSHCPMPERFRAKEKNAHPGVFFLHHGLFVARASGGGWRPASRSRAPSDVSDLDLIYFYPSHFVRLREI